MSSNIFLALKGISKTFPGVKALDNVELKIKMGEVHALVGENGAGKSTLTKILSGVVKPNPGGEILINEKKVTFKNIDESIKKGISVIYQDLSLFPNLTVAENICFGSRLDSKKMSIGWKEYRKIANSTFERMNIFIDPNMILGNLSVAKQQLVAIARAISFKAKLIIMDEPTASLSRTEAETLFNIIKSLKEQGVAILFISHKLDEIFRIADKISVLRDGEYIGTKNKDEIDEKELIKMMVGREIQYTKLNQKSFAHGEAILKVENLNKEGNYKDISFELRKGEILGITGLVGAGRTEVIQSLFGLNRCKSGKIYFEGKEVSITKPKDALRLGISYVPEHRQLEGLIMEMGIKENISLTNCSKIKSKAGIVSKKVVQKITTDVINKLDIRPPDTKRLAKDFSGGNQQKIVLGKWLETNPKILIVDEPTFGVDIGAKVEIHKLLRELAKNGIAIIMVSSEMQEILTLTDRVIVMRRGTMQMEMDTNNVTQETIMEAALKNDNGGDKNEKTA